MIWDDPDGYIQERDYRRRRLLRAVRGYFYRERRARLVFAGLLMAGAVTTAITSTLLLSAGLWPMFLRWPLAVVAGGGAVLALVRWWRLREYPRFAATGEVTRYLDWDLVEEARDFDDGSREAEVMRKVMDGGRHSEGGGCTLVVALVFGWALLFLGRDLFESGPTLLAEVFIDGVMSERHPEMARRMQVRPWLLLMALAPEARTVGDVLRHHRKPPQSETPR